MLKIALWLTGTVCSAFLLVWVAASSGCGLEEQQKALVDFYAATSDPGWLRAEGWSNVSMACEFQGQALPVRAGSLHQLQ